MTRSEANEGRVNPGFGRVAGTGANCQSCVVAFEARLRGYDVKAKPNVDPGSAAGYLADHTNAAWIDPFTGDPPEIRRPDPKTVRTAAQAQRWLEENVQPGQRYTLEFDWPHRGGHILCVDRAPDGGIRLYDPQTGGTFSGKGAQRFLRDSRRDTLGLTRIDDAIINAYFADEITEKA